MSQNGNLSLSIAKRDLANSKLGKTFARGIEFAHLSSGNETFIDFNNLVLPPQASLEGFNNPSALTLVEANITQNKGNVRVHSSARGELQHFVDFYIRSNNKIVLNYTTEENEILTGVIHNVLKTEPEALDLKPLVVTATLAEGQTDIVTGKSFKVGENIGSQLGEIIWFRSNKPMLRNTGNAVDGEGNYYEVGSIGSYSNLIRFNEAGDVGGEIIIGVAYGRMYERPSNSFLQEVETLGGQLDLISSFLQSVHNLDTNLFQGAPNQVDLVSFGQKVLNIENQANNLEINKQNVIKVAYVKDVRPSGTDAGDFNAGDWRQKPLNTIEGDSEIVTLNTNRFTLQAGKYDIEVISPAYFVNRHKAKLFNFSKGIDQIIGSNAWSPNNGGSPMAQTDSEAKGTIIINEPNTFEVLHICQTTKAGDGFGIDTSFGVDEIYTQVKITKLE